MNIERLRRPRFLSRFRRPKIKTVHVGTEYGGWLVPDGFLKPGMICYCAGAGEDVSFDVRLAEHYGAEVWILDPTPKAIRHFEDMRRGVVSGQPFPINNNAGVHYDLSRETLARLHFVPTGLWDVTGSVTFFGPKDPSHVSHSIVNLQQTDTGFTAEVQRLRDAMLKLGHERIDLLKLDIEGAECAVLESIMDDNLDIGVLCVEFDEALQNANAATRDRAEKTIARLQKSGYLAVEMDESLNGLFVREDIAREIVA